MPLVSRRTRFAVILVAVLLLAYGLAGWFGIPAAVRWALAGPVSQELGRAVSVQEVRANPFTLRVQLNGLEIAPGPDETEPLLRVQAITANAAWSSLLQRAAVIDQLEVRGLAAHIVRTGPQQFNVSDIVERILAKPASPTPTHFAVYNIELSDSAIRFDDRVRKVVDHVSQISLGIPFISNFPSDREVQVQPRLAARVNGQPFELKGETLPFEASLDTVLKLRLDDFDLPHLAGFSPLPLNFVVQKGKLASDLSLTFRRATAAAGDHPASPTRLILAGTVSVSDFALAAPAGTQAQPLLAFGRLSVRIDELGLLIHRIRIGDLQLDAPRLTLVRSASGLNWAEFAQRPLFKHPPGAAPAPAAPAAPATPWTWSLDKLQVSNGALEFTDQVLRQPPRRAEAIRIEASGLASNSATPAHFNASLATPEKESLTLDGEFRLAPLAATVRVAADEIDLARAAPYWQPYLRATLAGRSSASATVAIATPAEAPGAASKPPAEPEITVSDLQARTTGLRLRGPAGSGAALELKQLTLDGGTLSLSERRVALGRIAFEAPRATVTRLADGGIGWRELLVPQAAPAQPAAPWTVRVAELDVAGGDLRFEDLSTQPAARLRVNGVQLNAKQLAPGTAERSELRLRAYQGRGWVSAGGWVAFEPLATWMWVDARNLNLALLRPYFSEHLNAVVSSAEASARGNFELVLPAGAPPRYNYFGNARLSNLQVLEPDGAAELLRWQQLTADKVALRSPGATGTPLQLDIGHVALSDFYARGILSPEGRLNLAEVLRRAPPAGAAATAATSAAEAQRPQIQVGGIQLTRGQINFTDNFIKPNYTANVTGLSGTVAALSSDDTAVPAKVDVNGKIDGEAPVSLAGTVNPLTRQLSLDLRGNAEGIDLPSFTPYSVKYAGYPITKGKLSLAVNYKVADGQLSADNRIVLDQLTFGERVDSPDATKLPVLLAVSLLKNSQGNIDINLPISGSLNDPQFSLGGILFRAVVNLLVKAVTAPFSLLASAFGDGGEELGYIAFAPGSSSLVAEQIAKLGTLAKALADRPGLKLDIIGRVDPALDVPGLKDAKLLAKLRALRVKELVRAGDAADPATVTISAAQRPALIAAVYSDEAIPDKPRNFLGFAKTLPTAEQEQLILANLKITPEDLRALANQRAYAVRAWLEADGQVPRERIYIVEPKLTTEGIKEGAPTPRVDFELK